jgi:hypothetical protein
MNPRSYKWIRVTPKDRCSICGKPDYCDYCPELALALCMRVTSDRPSRCSLGGHLHKLNGVHDYEVPEREPESRIPKLNVTKLMSEWMYKTKAEWIGNLASDLGVSYGSLISLGCAWCQECKAWAFQMVNGYGEPVGIRLRKSNGKKFAYPGSHNGLFIPHMQPQSTAWITEGPTSAAAAITLGLYPISRPSCNGSLAEVGIACKRLGVRRAIIVADNDEDKLRPDDTTYNPGVDSSEALQNMLPIPSVIWVPPAKDIRVFLQLGGTAEIIHSTIRNLIWKQPSYGSPTKSLG